MVVGSFPGPGVGDLSRHPGSQATWAPGSLGRGWAAAPSSRVSSSPGGWHPSSAVTWGIRQKEDVVEGCRSQTPTPIPSPHLHLLAPEEKEDEEGRPSLQGQAGPPGLGLPALQVQAVADDMRLAGVEAWVEVDGDIRPGVQAAAALKVHLEPGERCSRRGTPGREPRDPEGREEPPARCRWG